MEAKIHWIEMNHLHLMKTFCMNQPKIVSKMFMFYHNINYHQLRYGIQSKVEGIIYILMLIGQLHRTPLS